LAETHLRLPQCSLREHSTRLIAWRLFQSQAELFPEMNDPHFWEIILGNYRLIYRLRSGDVQILTVHHGARKLDLAELESGA
jgi:hypothetical protein